MCVLTFVGVSSVACVAGVFVLNENAACVPPVVLALVFWEGDQSGIEQLSRHRPHARKGQTRQRYTEYLASIGGEERQFNTKL